MLPAALRLNIFLLNFQLHDLICPLPLLESSPAAHFEIALTCNGNVSIFGFSGIYGHMPFAVCFYLSRKQRSSHGLEVNSARPLTFLEKSLYCYLWNKTLFLEQSSNKADFLCSLYRHYFPPPFFRVQLTFDYSVKIEGRFFSFQFRVSTAIWIVYSWELPPYP